MRGMHLLLAAVLMAPSLHAETKKPRTPTRAELLKGARVPERRDFPRDTKVSACENFHKHVCGPVEKAFKLPKDRSMWTFAFSDSAERLLQVKKNYFKGLQKGYEATHPRGKNVKTFFLSCMNVKARTPEEKALVQAQIREISTASTLDALRKLSADRMFTPFFSFAELDDIPNQDNPLRSDVYLSTDGLSLPEKTYYEKKENVEDVRALAEELFKALKLDKPVERARAVVTYETGLAKVYPTPAEFRQLISARTYMPQKNWLETYPMLHLSGVFGKLPESTQIRNLTKDGFEYLNGYLKSASVRDVQSVMIYNSVRDLMDDAYPKFFKAHYKFQRKHLGAPPVRPDREERCTRQVSWSLGRELDAELLPIMFPNFPVDEAVEVGEAVRAAILRGLEKNTWLSKEGREEAIRKIRLAELSLVKPRTEADWNFIQVSDLDEKKYFENYRMIRQARIDQMLRELSEDRNPTRWYMGPLTVNAYYTSADNKFVLPQGILQYPFFDGGLSRAENIGAMGAVVGHELGHGIDDEGAKYDSKGLLRQWMTMNDLKVFGERGGKFVERFNRIGHDGRLTLGENIGDHVGLTFAADAAFPDPVKADMEEVKKFFAAYARVWCGVNTPEMEKLLLKTDPHALGRARINEQVIHIDLFQKAYQCKAGDKMYLPPEERIRVW